MGPACHPFGIAGLGLERQGGGGSISSCEEEEEEEEDFECFGEAVLSMFREAPWGRICYRRNVHMCNEDARALLFYDLGPILREYLELYLGDGKVSGFFGMIFYVCDVIRYSCTEKDKNRIEDVGFCLKGDRRRGWRGGPRFLLMYWLICAWDGKG